MRLLAIDWVVIAAYCVIALAIGAWYSRRAAKNIEEFFVAGRNLSWWIAGTSIVATTFAADTPLAVARLTRGGGIYENWLWWSSLMSGLLCVFFYAHLWRRAEILTDVEFIELRYEGKSAAVLRGFMALYSGVLQNCIVMAWVIVAMVKISGSLFDLSLVNEVVTAWTGIQIDWGKIIVITTMTLITLLYTVLSGFWGVVMTDFIQFIIAMTGSISLAAIVVYKMGGFSEMAAKIQESQEFEPRLFHFVPDFATATKLALITFVIQVTVQWWGGGQGGGYIAQRLFATRSERDSALAALWFNFAHYVLRPWPWIIVGLASIVFIPQTDLLDPITGKPDFERVYPMMMVRFLPSGLRGLMVASLLAAFMSTIDTQLNWGASYIVNDLYKRFLKKSATEKHYVFISRFTMVTLMILGGITAWNYDSITEAWIYLAKLTAGAGFVGLLRWYWWRVNAWAEITALLASLITANANLLFRLLHRIGWVSNPLMEKIDWLYSSEAYALLMLIIIVVCTAAWILVMYLTGPVSNAKLEVFYRRVRPGGWWKPIAQRCNITPPRPVIRLWLPWAAGVLCIYTAMFGVGYICLAEYLRGFVFLFIAAGSGTYMVSQASLLKD